METIDSEQATPSLSQAQRMKKFSQDGKLTEDVMLAIISEEKKSDLDKVTFSADTLRKYFPRSYTPRKMEETIIRLLYSYDEEVDVEAEVQDIDYENVTQYLINRLEPIYSYKAKGDCGKSFDYLGKELLPQRGTLIYREFDRGASDLVVTSYEKELWILEDMTLTVVMCFSVGVVGEDMTYSTEFRIYKGDLEKSMEPVEEAYYIL